MPSIKACHLWNNTGIRLEAGRTYRMTATGRWHDAWNTCGPDGYKSNNPVLTWAGHWRRAPTQDWFVLMGTINQDTTTMFRIGSAAQITAATTGTLYCFANDVPGMYWNNWGSVDLTVTPTTPENLNPG